MSTPLVPDSIVRGEKFIKWDEDSGVGTPVTLHIDENGFFLYWIDQNKEMDLLDISTIRDSRTGKQAKIPKDLKLRQIVSMGCAQDTLEEKTVTICSGPDFVNLTFINFCCTKKEIAQLWTDHILKLAYSLTQLNSSVTTFLCKAHTKLTLNVDKAGKIPVKNVVKMFAQNKEDRKRVKSALEAVGFPSGKDEMLSALKFSFEEFFNFYKSLTQRTEIEKIFEDICGTSKRKLMTASQLVEFLNKTQRDPRLNEILHPYADLAKAKDLIAQYEPNKGNVTKSLLSLDGFLGYLMSSDNSVVSVNKLELTDDMDQPLAHYFINSSHNTYLTGHQLTGKSSVEMYRQCLLAGCRCVELDFWNGGRTEEPVIVHGYTFVPEIPAKDVIEAIAESAFKTSDYPVILSFENHCNPKQQAKIAQYCRDIFGDMLLDQPLDAYQLEPGVALPPPSMLKRKIIIKNKKKHHHSNTATTVAAAATTTSALATSSPAATANKSDSGSGGGSSSGGGGGSTGGGDETITTVSSQLPRQSSKDENPEETNGQDIQLPDDESESSSEDEDDDDDECVGEKPAAEKTDKPAGGPAKESEAGAEISALVNYVQPVHFSTFEVSEKKNRFYEMSSFDEKQATMLLKETPIEFVKYNKRQLSRIYPAGTRFDSSNFMPQVFWNAGCQLVALNYQTLDLAMQLNLGTYEYNHRCGYLLKPEFMRRPDRRFDPFAESTVDGIIAGSVTIHVISGQFLTDKRCGTYVEVDMYGLPADTVRKKFRTRIVPNNAINPTFDEEPFVFKKVVLPDLACIRIAAYEEGGKFIGHRVLPVVGLCPGYRHVSLRSECGQPLGLPTLFVLIVVKDYVPDGLSDFAEALANPIKYQSELEKRAKQLAVLTDEDIDEATQIANDEMLVTAALMGAGKCKRAVVHPQLQTQTSGGGGGGVTTQGAGGGSGSGSSLLVLHHLALAPPNPAASTTNLEPPPASPLPPPPTPTASLLLTGKPTPPPSVFDPAALAGVVVNEASPPKSPPIIATVASTTAVVPTVTSSTMPNLLSDEIMAESLETFIESKPVKEKKIELEKKLEALRKKQDKERTRVQSMQETDKSRTKFYISNKLVKRLSSKNIVFVCVCNRDLATTTGSGDVEASGVGTRDTDKTKVGAGEADKSSEKVGVGGKTSLPRSHSERMLAIHRDHINQERDLQDKYHEMVFAVAHKTMVTSQSQQLKLLRTLLDRETNQVMRRLQTARRQEVKALAKQHRDRDELIRMKREVASAMVEKGVHECVRLKELYEKKREELEKQHMEVRNKLAAEKAKVKATLEQEYEGKCTKVEEEIVDEANR